MILEINKKINIEPMEITALFEIHQFIWLLLLEEHIIASTIKHSVRIEIIDVSTREITLVIWVNLCALLLISIYVLYTIFYVIYFLYLLFFGNIIISIIYDNNNITFFCNYFD